MSLAETGSVNTNFVPVDPDSTQIRPPCASMIVREIDRPSAVPPTRRLDAENGSKMRSRSSGAIGSPEVCTDTPTASSHNGGAQHRPSGPPPPGPERGPVGGGIP